MKLTKKLQAGIGKVYNAYWEAYLKGDIKTMASCLDDNYKVVGSGEGEVFFNKKEAIKYFKATATGVAGKAEMRNRDIKMETIDELVLITEQMDMYALIENEWIFYSKGRLTTMLHEKEGGWKIVQQHGSFPDTRADEGEQLDLERISKENIELSDEVKRKAIELEQKSRELEIEAALERVRARAMAMQKSDELSELVDIVFKELTKLDFALTWCIINIIDEGSMSNTVWAANPDITKAPESYHMLFEDYPFHHAMMKGWKERNTKSVYTLEGDEKRIYDEYLFSETEFKRTPEAAQAASRAMEKYVVSFSFSNFGGLQTVGNVPLSDANLDILSRFGKVFDLTYTRFNDLKQAEAQARESQIQLAMERVRARTMAMQRSDELGEAAALLFKQVHSFGVSSFSCGFNIWETDNISVRSYMAKPDGTLDATIGLRLPHIEHPHFIQSYEARKKGEGFFVMEAGGKELEDTYRYMFSIPEWEKTFGNWDDSGFPLPTFQISHYAFFSQGYLLFITYEPVPEMWDIFKRFAKVFEQTYTRFLDLQKAEAQARESQIQLAMERVRARTMAMQRSDELPDAALLLSNQVKELGVQLWGTSFQLWEEDRKEVTIWACIRDSMIPSFKIPTTEDSLYIHIADSAQKGESLYVEKLDGEAFENHLKYMMSIPAFREGSERVYSQGFIPPSSMIYHAAFFSNGFILFITLEPCPGVHDLFTRFARVFEQTYTRFLDLQKAEAQAGEAQIEASLERVRSKTMAMHNSNDVGETVAAMFAEFVHLGIRTNRCGILIFDDNDSAEVWTARTVAEGKATLIIGKLDLKIYDLLSSAYKSWKEKKPIYQHELHGDDIVRHYEAINRSENYPVKFDMNALPQKEFHSDFFFPEGAVFAFTAEPITDEHSKIMKRFAGVFGQTYRRYLDLQKAEAQAREAKIEAALEKVRSKAMAMQKSEDLADAVEIVFEELGKLDIGTIRCGISIISKENRTTNIWSTTKTEKGTSLQVSGDESMDIHPLLQGAYAAWLKQEDYSYLLQGEDLQQFYTALASTNFKLPDAPGEMQTAQQYMYVAHFPAGGLYVFSEKALAEEAKNVTGRLADVFNLTYTRFNDLKQAEAQVKEAKIETALERIRSRTMAMHKSEELAETAQVLFNQLIELGDIPARICICILDEKKEMVTFWATDQAGSQINFSFQARLNEPTSISKMYAAWKAGQKSLVIDLEGTEMADWIRFAREEIGIEVKEELLKTHRVHTVGFFSHGWILLTTHELQSAETVQLLERFSTVFNLTFRRFLDLQQSEANTREAQIEAGLERVRSRTMAMHSSDDVSVATATMFNELERLNIQNFRGGILNIRHDQTMEVWSVNTLEDGRIVRAIGDFDMTMHPFWQQLYTGWINKDDLFSFNMVGRDKEDYIRILDARRDYLPNGMQWFPDCYVQAYYFGEGAIWCFCLQPHSDDNKQVMKRFASVFSLTFRRYQDLRKAEAQAREATIEAALEKVRGRAMAMHNSNDLSATASMVFTELRKLGINPMRCGVGLLTKESRRAQLYSATSSADGDSLSLVGWIILSKHPVAEKIYDTWLSNEDYYPELSGEELKSYYENLLAGLSLPAVPDWQNGQKQYGTFLTFSVGCLYAWSEIPYNETEIKILKRFGSIIDLTFRRYIELQKSESNAREAVKQAALDRVRADIASMRTISDLDRITPLIWNELNILGVPFIRCGVFIMDNSQQLIHTFLSTPDGKAIAAFHLPYDTPGNIGQVLSHWNENRNYIDHWDESAFTDLADILVKQGAIASPGQYLSTIPRGGFYLHFLPFLQGMLYVGNTTQLSEDEIKLIQSVADAFSTAYARYEDFNKLEAAKQQVDQTLVELKQTQTQLVQSEKMASLGELTAGIAHEIQNPLNFVNNFSEVSTELLDEMITELGKGNNEDAVAIADDVKQNLEKILHHGKRADGIVKGMLQHSRSSTAVKEPTDINKLADEYLRLAYHGLRAKDKSFNATLKTDYDDSIGNIDVIPQDIGRAVLNLITNAFYVVGEKNKQAVEGYEPTVLVSTKKNEGNVEIRVGDNGNGIPQKVLDKIFQPFFTTKPTGQGTGLGLSLAYDIVKAHGGEIKVNTAENEGTEFIIQIPAKEN